MIQLLTAVQTAFNANISLSSLFPNGLENAEAADTEALPTCVLVEVSSNNDYNTSRGYVETGYIQFTVRSTNAGDVRNALEYLQSTYDHKPLALSPDLLMDSRIVMGAIVKKEDERVWRGDVEYKFVVGRNLS